MKNIRVILGILVISFGQVVLSSQNNDDNAPFTVEWHQAGDGSSYTSFKNYDQDQVFNQHWRLVADKEKPLTRRTQFVRNDNGFHLFQPTTGNCYRATKNLYEVLVTDRSGKTTVTEWPLLYMFLQQQEQINS